MIIAAEDIAAIFNVDDGVAIDAVIDGECVPGYLLDFDLEASLGPGVEGRQVTFICDKSLVVSVVQGEILTHGSEQYAVASIRPYGFSGLAELELVDA